MILLNDPRLLLLPAERGGHGLAGQWADDFRHAVHARLTGERAGSYADFGDLRQVADTLGEPFLFAGRYSPRRDRRHGAPPAADLTGERSVACLQNHDQVGDRGRGERLAGRRPPRPVRRGNGRLGGARLVLG